MPKQTTDIAKVFLNRIKATARIRRSKPTFAAAFATAMTDGKASVVVQPKLPKALGSIRDHGTTGPKGTSLKDQTNGYVWYEGDKIVVSMQKGGVATARKTIRAYFSDHKVGSFQVEEGPELTDAEIAQIDDMDDDERARLEREDAPASAPQAAADAPQAADEPQDEPAAQADEPAQAPQVEEPDQERPTAADLPPEVRKAVEKVTTGTTAILTGVFKRVPGIEVDEAVVAARMQDRLSNRMAEIPAEMQEHLMQTGPGRLLMSMSRDVMLERLDRTDIPEVLESFAPDSPIGAGEVTDHFMDLANRMVRRVDGDARISRLKLEQRVNAFIQDAQSGDEKLEALKRLSAVLLPVLRHPQKLQENFGGVAPMRTDNVTPATLGTVELLSVLNTALNQIAACRAAHDRGLQASEGKGLSAEEGAFFDDLTEELMDETVAFTDQAEVVAQRMERGDQVDAKELSGLTDAANALNGFVAQRFAALDECDPSQSPTTIRALYRDTLGRFIAQTRAVA